MTETPILVALDLIEDPSWTAQGLRAFCSPSVHPWEYAERNGMQSGVVLRRRIGDDYHRKVYLSDDDPVRLVDKDGNPSNWKPKNYVE